jgi:ABC-type glycerol-3-phosphate transport system substrate-binding protein
MWQCDGGLLDRNPEGRLVSLISKPGTQRALAAWKTLGETTGYSPRNIPLTQALTARTDFLAGKAAMAITGGTFATALAQLNLFPWEVIPMPYLGRHVSSGGLMTAGIGKHSRNPAQGLEAIAILLAPSAQQQLASSVAGISALPLEPSLSTGFAGLYSVMREAMKTMRHDYFIPSSESYALIYGMFLDYWDGKEDLASVCARFDDWLQAYNHGHGAASLSFA